MNTIADLRNTSGNGTAVVDGYYIERDGGGGTFVWDDACTLVDDGGATILPNGWQGAGRWRRVMDGLGGAVDVRWFGAWASPGFPGFAGHSGATVGNAEAFEAAIRSLTPVLTAPGATTYYGPRVMVPSGRFVFTRSLIIDRSAEVVGVGDEILSSSLLDFPKDMDGVVLQQDLPPPNPPPSPPLYLWPRAARSRLRGLKIRSLGVGTVGHGIKMDASVDIDGCYVENFGGNGIHGDCTAPKNNCNGFSIRRSRVTNCHHGLYLDGADSNAGMTECLSLVNNRGWGIYDSCFLGNMHLQPHAAGNLLGSYKSDNVNARTAFVNAYAEGDQPEAQVVYPSQFFGGLVSNAGTGGQIGTGKGSLLLSRNAATMQNDIPDAQGVVRTLTNTLGGKVPGAAQQLGASGVSQLYSLRYEMPWITGYAPNTGWWTWEFGGVTRGIAFGFCDNKAPEYNEGKGGAKAWFQNGFYLGHHQHGQAGGGGRMQVSSGSAPPTTGTWYRGDRIENALPSAGGWGGWVCVTASSPTLPGGVWKGYGKIED